MTNNSYDFDLFTIGAGSGGVRASRVAAGLGKRVAIAEKRFLGGTCVNVGCVPKKLLSYAAQFGEAFDDSRGFGWSVDQSKFNWTQLIAAKDREIERLNSVYGSLLDSSGVSLVPTVLVSFQTHEELVAPLLNPSSHIRKSLI